MRPPTAYNERVFWQAGRNLRQYAVFSATVIAAASEQDSDFHEKAKHKLTYIPVIRDNDIPVTGSGFTAPRQTSRISRSLGGF